MELTLSERKKVLLKHSAREVRSSRTLFAEFVFIYQAEGGNPAACHSCQFGTIYNRWQKEAARQEPQIEKALKMSNTFKLRNPKEVIYVPKTGAVITQDSPDELVNEYLNQDKGKYREIRTDRYFAQVPEEQPKKKPAKKAVKKD